ncbi:uncharacterized protein EDB93DRAFT_1103143 [Suillus bovinus]|uniref:uncharacterized protein n=1 Tax=Suillus bovinus TaxID=48563 RepID=UPI001B8701B4|nr:uncharacterized protein EDB93DRAFT_1103143 [Suillus bovinus]KAG2151179.1 hypothetical protein EDB93DRAFT_1103143 [Suillus bovinus]
MAFKMTRMHLHNVLNGLLCHLPRKAHSATNAAPSHIQTPTTVTASNEDDSDIDLLHSKPRRLTKGKKCARAAANSNSELSAGAELEPDSLLNEAGPSATINPPQAPAIVDNERDANGFLKDMQVMDIDEPKKSHQEQRSRDTNKKISAPYSDDKGKKYHHCMLCSKKTKKPVAFVNEVMTMHRHMEALHWNEYIQWADHNKFTSMLPRDIKCRKLDTAADSQARLDAHLSDKKPKDRIIPYSDALFCDAAIKWLIETDQPINAINHKSFKYMIDTATRQAIIDLFKRNLTDLRNRLLLTNIEIL